MQEDSLLEQVSNYCLVFFILFYFFVSIQPNRAVYLKYSSLQMLNRDVSDRYHQILPSVSGTGCHFNYGLGRFRGLKAICISLWPQEGGK